MLLRPRSCPGRPLPHTRGSFPGSTCRSSSVHMCAPRLAGCSSQSWDVMVATPLPKKLLVQCLHYSSEKQGIYNFSVKNVSDETPVLRRCLCFCCKTWAWFPGLSVGDSEDGDRSWSTGRGSHCRAGRHMLAALGYRVGAGLLTAGSVLTTIRFVGNSLLIMWRPGLVGVKTQVL